MRHFSGRAALVALGFSVVALILLGIAPSVITARYAKSENMVSHTHEVATYVSRVRADLVGSESGRLGYILTGDARWLQQYSEASQHLPLDLRELKSLTSDNASQQKRVDSLDTLIARKAALMKQSIDLRQSGQADQPQQEQISEKCADLIFDISALLNDMRQEETNLLERREMLSAYTYGRIRTILALSFLAVVLLLLATTASVLSEIKERKLAETAVRRLSSRILELQDLERRRVARELHDSIGQYFSSLGMSLSMLDNEDSSLSAEKRKALLAQCVETVKQGVAESRTISHLLHPPLLDEMGFASAASWYVDGFKQRSNLEVALEIPPDLQRMPREIELVLFRVLQEGLTNIHKHSNCNRAETRVITSIHHVTLSIEDDGKGIPPALLEKFERTNTGTGVGLAGMRERVRDLKGDFKLASSGHGTVLQVTLPLVEQSDLFQTTPGPAVPKGGTDAQTEKSVEGKQGDVPGPRLGAALAWN